MHPSRSRQNRSEKPVDPDTQSPSKILFYVDTSVFAGHDLMSLAASDAIREHFPGAEITWLMSDDNPRMLQRLQEKDYQFSFLVSTARDRLLKHPFAALRAVLANARKIRRLAPDVVVIAQGVVTLSFLGSIASRLAGVAYCCYLPMGSLASECDVESDSRTLDALWRFCYRRTPNYITIDGEQKRLIVLSNPKATIRVVENHVPRNNGITHSPDEARKEWNIPGTRPVIGVIGRLRFAQKNQDWLVRQLAADPFWKDYLVLIVGDGPDSARLRQIVLDLKLRDQVRMVGWSDKVETLYPALDLLLIPSRSEGVPLVMLEALSYRVPVAATNRDGMKEWLPQDWRFEVGDGEGMKRAVLSALRRGDPEFWRETSRHLDSIHDSKRFYSNLLSGMEPVVNQRFRNERQF